MFRNTALIFPYKFILFLCVDHFEIAIKKSGEFIRFKKQWIPLVRMSKIDVTILSEAISYFWSILSKHYDLFVERCPMIAIANDSKQIDINRYRKIPTI